MTGSGGGRRRDVDGAHEHRIHDDEPDTGRATVRLLLAEQAPDLAALALRPLRSSGTENALYRLGDHLVVRLPRTPSAVTSLDLELAWLPRLAGVLPAAVPQVERAGVPGPAYPHRWAVLRWLPGRDAWATRDRPEWFGADLGHRLAEVVGALRARPVDGAPARLPGERGGPLAALDEAVERWLAQGDALLDVGAVRRVWHGCREAAGDDIAAVLLHGDLIPGNLLLARGRLSAVIDWGGLGAGDPAQDLDPAWSVLDADGAQAFREALEVDDAQWQRARGFALEQAIGAVVYYTPRRHPLADVMRRTLERLLAGR